jgi:hypothetical protein
VCCSITDSCDFGFCFRSTLAQKQNYFPPINSRRDTPGRYFKATFRVAPTAPPARVSFDFVVLDVLYLDSHSGAKNLEADSKTTSVGERKRKNVSMKSTAIGSDSWEVSAYLMHHGTRRSKLLFHSGGAAGGEETLGGN